MFSDTVIARLLGGGGSRAQSPEPEPRTRIPRVGDRAYLYVHEQTSQTWLVAIRLEGPQGCAEQSRTAGGGEGSSPHSTLLLLLLAVWRCNVDPSPRSRRERHQSRESESTGAVRAHVGGRRRVDRREGAEWFSAE